MVLSSESTWPRVTGTVRRESPHDHNDVPWGLPIPAAVTQEPPPMKRAAYPLMSLMGLHMGKQLPGHSAAMKMSTGYQCEWRRDLRIFYSDQSFNWLVSLGHVSPSLPLHREDPKPGRPCSRPLEGTGTQSLVIRAVRLGTTWWSMPPLLPGQRSSFVHRVEGRRPLHGLENRVPGWFYPHAFMSLIVERSCVEPTFGHSISS